MKITVSNQHLIKLGLAAALVVAGSASQAQDATWIGGAGTTDWNDDLNWDIGVPAEGTNAIVTIGSFVDYNAPMAASSFATLSSSGELNINAGGFTVDGTGDGVIGLIGTTARLWVNNGGVVTLPNGGLSLSNGAAMTVAAGGSVSIQGSLLLGRNANNNVGFVTNNGGTISAAATSVNPNNNSFTSLFVINGGVNNLGDVLIKRSSAGAGAPGLGTEGMVVNGGQVQMTSLDMGGTDGNSWLTLWQTDGVVTNTGDFVIRQNTASRASRFMQTGGLFVSEGESGVNLRGHTGNNAFVFYSVTGGTNLVNGFVLGNPDGTDVTGTVRLTNAAKIYIGNGGMTSVGSLNTKTIVLSPSGIFGAQTDWVGTEPIILAGGTFDCANLDGTPHNITISGVISGGSALNKTGAGTLTLDGANTYSGNTVISQGKLVVGASGSLPNSPQIIVGAGTTFDVSAAVGFTLGSARTLAGDGTVVGEVAVDSGGIISPGTSVGTLTLSDSLTMNGGAVARFELPTTPGPGNDFLIINGDLNASGVNTIEIVGGEPGAVHTLIQYGGTFNGDLANFDISGAIGVLSNNPTTKTISLVVEGLVRDPGNVVWVGNSENNGWDNVGLTNWINTGTGLLDYFVPGDNVLFSDAGAANSVVNIIGNNSPATVTIGSTAPYTFTGSGSIAGSGSLIKTNTGTVRIETANTYTGPTILAGGVLEATTLDNGGLASSIGAASINPENLVFDGGTLRYSGGSITFNRSATLDDDGGTLEIQSEGTTITLSGSLTGTGQFNKTGDGSLILTAASDYSGGTRVAAGTLRVNLPGAAGTGTVTLDGGTLFLGLASDTDIPNPIAVISPSSLVMGNANNRVNGAVSGAADLDVTVNSGAVLTFNGNLTNYTGTFNLGNSGGTFRFNSGGGNTTLGAPNATIDLGSSTAALQARNAGTMYVGALRGGPGTFLRGQGSGSGTLTWEIGSSTNNPSTTFEGTIEDGAASRLAALRKVGPGVLTLTGNSTYSGITTISEGTLKVDGSLGFGSVFVSGGTLAGSGTVNGSVDVQFDGTIAPGSEVGALTINGFLTLGGNTVIEVDRSGSYDQIIANGGVFFGGTLTVVNVGDPLQVGDNFQIFTAGSGEFFEIVGSPGPGLSWNFNPDNGVLTVVSAGHVLNYTQVGNALEFSWDGNFFLEVQTNNLSTGLSDNWVAYPGGDVSPVTVTLDPNAPAVFFRLRSADLPGSIAPVK